nr:hypothetical protein [Thermomonas carbonis]
MFSMRKLVPYPPDYIKVMLFFFGKQSANPSQLDPRRKSCQWRLTIEKLL